MMDEEQWRRINDKQQVVNFVDTAKERFERKQRADFAKGAAMREKMRRVNEQKFEEMKNEEEREQTRQQVLANMDAERNEAEKSKNSERTKKVESQSRDQGRRISLSIQAAAQERAKRLAQGKAKMTPVIAEEPVREGDVGASRRKETQAKLESEQAAALKASNVDDYQVNEGRERSGYCSGGDCTVM